MSKEQKLTSEQIESIVFEQMGDMFAKRLEKVNITNPLQNIGGMVRIGKDYYKWVKIP